MAYQLTFVATRRPASEALSPSERLNRLYESARGFEVLGLTGLVLHHGNRLLYCLEGSEESVVAQYQKIKGDHRIQGVAILRQQAVRERCFDRWGFAVDDDPRDNQPATLAERVVALVQGAPTEIRQTFLAFAKLDLHPSPK